MKVNEIFYSLQGEGVWTGTASVFIRLSGCNLKCGFCDTRHQSGRQMAEEEIAAVAAQYPSRHAVITGGEPTLQLTPQLLRALKEHGFYIQLETNGTMELPQEALELIDWVTCSPKTEADDIRLRRIDELKVVCQGADISLEQYFSGPYATVKARCLQPCDTGSPTLNLPILLATIALVKADPRWRLSLQTHKLINIP